MSKIVKMAILLVALTATFSFAGGYAFRAGFSLYDYSTGNSKADKNINIGYGFGGGLVSTVSLTSTLSFVSEFNFLYRKPMIQDLSDYYGSGAEAYETEFAISIPIMFQLAIAEGIPYFAAGIQLDTPISPKITLTDGKEEESESYDDRASIDLGVVLGVGYLITPSIGIDARVVIGLTEPTRNGEDSWKQYGAGLTYYF
jgi:outer membrane immunogenic protein